MLSLMTLLSLTSGTKLGGWFSLERNTLVKKGVGKSLESFFPPPASKKNKKLRKARKGNRRGKILFKNTSTLENHEKKKEVGKRPRALLSLLGDGGGSHQAEWPEGWENRK